MGSGFYDKALSVLDDSVKKTHLIGLAYEFQKLDHIQPNKWDIALDCIVTEKRSTIPKASSICQNSLMNSEEQKKQAALKSLEFIADDCVLGVGTGSTVNHLIAALPSVKNKIEAVTSSSKAKHTVA